MGRLRLGRRNGTRPIARLNVTSDLSSGRILVMIDRSVNREMRGHQKALLYLRSRGMSLL